MPRRAIIAGMVAVVLAGVPAGQAAAADPGERAEALLFAGAVNRFVAKQVPSTFSIRGDRDAGIGAQDVTLVDARYCGATARGHGRLVGVLRSASSGESAPAALPSLEARDCHAKLEELAKEQNSIQIAKLDVDANPEWATRFDVLSLPTVLVFGGGEVRARVLGAQPRRRFEQALAEVLPAGEGDGPTA